MDTELWLYQTRKQFQKRSQNFSLSQLCYNLLLPPLWMIRYRDRRFCSLYRDQYILLTKGRIIWGQIVQANTQLFTPGKSNCPAAIVCSLDPFFNSNLTELLRIARELYDLKHQVIEHPEMLDLKIFAEAITDEKKGLLNMTIPSSIARERLVYYTSIMVYRKHIPLGYLQSGWFPILIAPSHTSASMILPAKYWSPNLLEFW